MRLFTLRACAIAIGAICIQALHASVSIPPPTATNTLEAFQPRIDLSKLPKELQPLKLDALVMSSGDKLSAKCAELIELAYELKATQPSRPGPHAVLWMCYMLEHRSEEAFAELSEARTLLQKMRGPAGRWPGETFYQTQGPSDALAFFVDHEGTLVAETLEIGEGGATLFDCAWWRNPDGKIERFRFDISANAAAIGLYMTSLAPPAGRDLMGAIAGYNAVLLATRQGNPDPAALLALARFGDRMSWLDASKIDNYFEAALAQGDEFSSYSYAQRLLETRHSAFDAEHVRNLLRGAAGVGLPEAQILLGALCESALHAQCTRDEAKTARAAAEKSLDPAQVEFQRYLIFSRSDLRVGDADKAQRALSNASEKGNTAAMNSLAWSLGLRKGHESEALRWRERSAAAGDSYALYKLARDRLEAAQDDASRAAAVAQLRRAVDLGVAAATVALGNAYRDGRGVEKDLAEGARLYRLGAEWGEEVAQNNYAFVLRRGEGVAADPVAARYWFMRSLMAGHGSAASGMAELYENGEGVDKDIKRAVEYRRWGAELGNAGNQTAYANALWDGTGIEKDRSQAVQWYERAAAQGNMSALRMLSYAHQKGDGAQQSWPIALSGYRRCAEAGNAQCQDDLGWVLLEGPQEYRDVPQALSWLRKSAEQGNSLAANSLGWAYEHGEHVERDDKAAFAHYARCENLDVDEDSSFCLNNLGRAYMQGRGTERDPTRAVHLYERAIQGGSVHATCNLGEAYFDGSGVERDEKRALAMYKEAAEKGNARCEFLYGKHLLYKGGQGATALEFLRKAAAQDEAEAEEMIASALLGGFVGTQDEANGVAFAQACFQKGNSACAHALGNYYRWWRKPADRVQSDAWFEKAEAAGNHDAAYSLARLAYYGSEGKRDIEVARKHLEIVKADRGIASIWLALLDRNAGHADAARDALQDLAQHGNLAAQLYLVGLCAHATACGDDAPTRTSFLAELDAFTKRPQLLNNIVWYVAIDPEASREDAELAVAVAERFGDVFAAEWSRMDSHAAALARAGRAQDACKLQGRVIELAKKAKYASIDKLALRRDAYCRGEAWQGD